ncbi:hypothetical protein E2C01_074604 [Portunus trituberculatus]|uniref:Uncharacterized protein n=1 Tax=Portunus trituberculatus TaxID=210409 RepID=A0A5B7I630_PORTR|nr:hypothetical protein [Portunus trituberculatus]
MLGRGVAGQCGPGASLPGRASVITGPGCAVLPASSAAGGRSPPPQVLLFSAPPLLSLALSLHPSSTSPLLSLTPPFPPTLPPVLPPPPFYAPERPPTHRRSGINNTS